ncbi:uncharacterized protein LOC113294875 [Papaver somniferum]|uniref:uncharacterized protein LOC113294875 n=1 Tax=Papaver somniferum TaxID=3469 RepID=UPI000E704C64|nr:uncharacterized protein LOC113294875 [Papaver somniferum]
MQDHELATASNLQKSPIVSNFLVLEWDIYGIPMNKIKPYSMWLTNCRAPGMVEAIPNRKNQRRKGLDVVGSFGLLQPTADGSKLILKEPISPSSVNFSLFKMAPVATFMLSMVALAVVPFDYGMVLSDPNIWLLYFFAISSLGVYGIIIESRFSN